MPGYHQKEIPKGKLGEISKIREELEELEDAKRQGNQILCLCEVADIIGAIQMYLEKHHPGTSFRDVLLMTASTRQAFEDGTRR